LVPREKLINAPRVRQMSLKWESFLDESFKLRGPAGTLQQYMLWSFTNLGDVLSAQYFTTLLLHVCEFNAGEIFLFVPQGRGGGE
jgi:hypothetical protein